MLNGVPRVGRSCPVGASELQMTPEASAIKKRPVLESTSNPAGTPPTMVVYAVWGVGTTVGRGSAVGTAVAAGPVGLAVLPAVLPPADVTVTATGTGRSSGSGSAVGTSAGTGGGGGPG